MSPYFESGGIVIYHADVRDVALDAFRADAVLADPPYGFDAYATDKLVPLGPVMAAAARVALFGYPELLVRWCLEVGRVPDEWITWWPSNATVKAGGRAAGLPRETEAIALFGDEFRFDEARAARSDNRPAVNGQVVETVRAGDVWRDASPGLGFNHHLRLHPNEKPLSLMRKLVSLCSAPGELIVDPFMGSGSTLRAAKDLGRRAVGIDIVEQHCETAARRLAQEVLCI